MLISNVPGFLQIIAHCISLCTLYRWCCAIHSQLQSTWSEEKKLLTFRKCMDPEYVTIYVIIFRTPTSYSEKRNSNHA